MDDWNMLSEQQGGMVWARQIDNDVGGFQFMDNSTSSIINNLKFAVAKQVRSMIIILAGFNIAMAVVLAFVIFRNCYKGAKRSDPAFGFRSSVFKFIETSEIFPFVLSIGISIQGIVYVVSQTKGLEGLLILGCTSISQAMLPALFTVPYIQLIFGLETAVQALRRRPFERRSRWVIVACLVVVIIGAVAIISSQNPLALTQIQLNLNMVASVASNVSGITFGVLYLFLRSRKMQKIGPLGHLELGGPRKEKSVESWPGTDIFNTQIEQPVSPARIFESRASTRMSEAIGETVGNTNRKGHSLEAIQTTSPFNRAAADGSELMNGAPSPVVTRARKDSYSLFPSQREVVEARPKGSSGILLPSTTYSPTRGNENTTLDNGIFIDLLPPPSIRISGAPRHNRDSSLVSSATVQIGLRVSNLSDVTRLEAPFYFSPERPFSPSRPDSSLAARPSYIPTSRDIGVAVSDDYRNSTRSPIGTTAEMEQSEKPITLSPTVYSPNNALSPRAKARRRSIDSISSTIGASNADASYSVGTTEWI
ncbi:uncharacterized protein Triagg1_10086 [Trichoderma aggressivum f. europaeum]|uniref:Uncharacterized protein n=1 Tax=Trichoderma aggressivum f. europaeum TaxID=173218 RepID=A0AAE1I7R5_9HYPO|nr:hypothetical protein Triagg1_10086 [Trichoderma aggressivum f. europaeum]